MYFQAPCWSINIGKHAQGKELCRRNPSQHHINMNDIDMNAHIDQTSDKGPLLA